MAGIKVQNADFRHRSAPAAIVLEAATAPSELLAED